MTATDTVDVVVVGTGAAGLAAAICAHDGGCQVALLEKAAAIGGTTAVSGGVMWLPGNHHMDAEPSGELTDAVDYLTELNDGDADPDVIDAFVRTAGEALAYLEAHTPLRTAPVDGLADYYHAFGVRGSRSSGRSVEPIPYPVGQELPEWRDRLATRGTLMSLGAVTTLSEDIARGSLSDPERLRREREDVRTKGAALVAMLYKGLLQRGVAAATNTAVDDLLIEDGAVTGVHGRMAGTVVRIHARRGVVLACGGFEWNQELVRSFLGADVAPLTPPNNVGDGLMMALRAGAELRHMTRFWGQPAMFDPSVGTGSPIPQFEWARGAPSSIVVDRQAKRFANEAAPYHDFARSLLQLPGLAQRFPGRPPAWLVFDNRVKRSVQILSSLPHEPPPPWFASHETVAGLAGQIGVDAGALEATVERFNAHAAENADPDFGRARQGMTGPGRVRPLVEAPFYALPIYAGTIGTSGGPRTDRDGRVHRHGGGVIPGLYAVGNVAAPALGDVYPGGGGTIGPALVFGFRAGRHLSSTTRRNAQVVDQA